MHRLAADLEVVVAEPPEQAFGKFGVADLGFLQAEDVGRLLDEEPLDDGGAGADRIDVPGGDLEVRHRWRCSEPAGASPPSSRDVKGPRSGGVERGPTKRCYARSIAWTRPGNRGENPGAASAQL